MVKINDIYELLENENKEIMVLIYTNSLPPENAKFILNESHRRLEIYRNKREVILLNGLQKETIEKIKKLDIIYVCELDASPNTDDDNKIIYAYTADVTTKEELQNSNKNTNQIISNKTQALKDKIQAKKQNPNS
jgi:hypothetical protein